MAYFNAGMNRLLQTAIGIAMFSHVLAQKLVITTIEDEPFYQVDANGNPHGYIVDLAELIAKQVPFTYEFKTVKDGRYGYLINETLGTWTGMMGELLEGTADMAMAPLTITNIRQRYVDLTPFMSTGISILAKRPSEITTPVLFFLEPFSYGVWLSIIASYILISLVLHFTSKYNTCCQEDSTVEASPSAGFLMKHRSLATRVAGFSWWLLTIVVISTYAANLSSALTVEKTFRPIYSADDLAYQHQVKYGSLVGGTTTQFFQFNKEPVYKRMWTYMSNEPGAMVERVSDGIERVRNSNGKYAMLMESTTIRYLSTRQPCDTVMIGDLLDSKDYGIATPKNSIWTRQLRDAVEYLRQNDELQKLEKKWWITKSQCPPEKSNEFNDGSDWSLTLKRLGGVFLSFVVLLIVAFLVLFLEILFKARRNANSRNVN